MQQRFYLTKYATDPQIGVVVADGEITAKQARIDPNRDHLTGYCRTFHFLDYVLDAKEAGEIATTRLMDQIAYHEEKIAQFQRMIMRLASLSEDTPTWTRMGIGTLLDEEDRGED